MILCAFCSFGLKQDGNLFNEERNEISKMYTECICNSLIVLFSGSLIAAKHACITIIIVSLENIICFEQKDTTTTVL